MKRKGTLGSLNRLGRIKARSLIARQPDLWYRLLSSCQRRRGDAGLHLFPMNLFQSRIFGLFPFLIGGRAALWIHRVINVVHDLQRLLD